MATISEALDVAINHHEAGRLQIAEQIYRQILQVDPNQADAWNLLGLVHCPREYEVAIDCFRHAIQLNGKTAAFHSNLGAALQSQGNLDEAVAAYRRALELNPDYADALSNLGTALKTQGNLDEAVACYRRALELKPNHSKGLYNLGAALQTQGNLDEAIACYRRALELNPDYAEALYNLGAALQTQGNLDEAVACHRRALERKPDYAEALYNLGAALQTQGNLDEAIVCHRLAMELKPDYPEVLSNLGAALQTQGNLDEAVATCRRALELKPDYAESLCNLGNAQQALGNLDEADANYRRALELKPDYAEAHCNRSLLWLRKGDFEHGWPEYEWRWKREESPPRSFRQPLWGGGPLAGTTILLHAEQGLGDAIQFIRYAWLVKDRGARVVVECPKPLMRLLSGVRGIDELIVARSPLPHFDVQAPLLSLPVVLHTTLATIPAVVPYLFAASDLVERWREEFGRSRKFQIGIAWQGNPKFKGDRFRSKAAMDALAQILD